MKLSKICLLFILIGVFACSKDNSQIVPLCDECNFDCLDENEEGVLTNDCLDNFTCAYKFFPDSAIDSDETLGVTSGSKNVFQIITQTQGSEIIADDEYTYILVFELDATLESFDTENNDLKLMNTQFRRICFCGDTHFVEIRKGCIQGRKDENGNWFVQGNVTADYSWGALTTKFDVQLD